MDIDQFNVALVHHWLLAMAGGERVCEAICEIVAKPDIFCLLADPRRLSAILKSGSITTSFIQNLPLSHKYYRYYAPLFPIAVELFDLRPYDLVISSDSSVVKGVLTRPDSCHICYCHSPMRYAWNMFQEYAEGGSPLKRVLMSPAMHYLRLYDHAASARVDHFVANSRVVRDRIRKYYRRDAKVIYPPCEVERFAISPKVSDYYLCVGRLVGYKRLDIAVRAFTMSGRRLVIVGEGPDEARLKAMAGRNIEFLGWASDAELASLYGECRALVFPAEEDFGIVPVEAQASGRPVIALGKGGALESIIPNETGMLFYEQTPEALERVVAQFEMVSDSFHPESIREKAQRFSKERFKREFQDFVLECWCEHEST